MRWPTFKPTHGFRRSEHDQVPDGGNRAAHAESGEREQSETSRASNETSHDKQRRRQEKKQQEQEEEETQRRNVMRAWLAPLLVGSATGPEAQTVARGRLEQCLAFAYEQNRQPYRSRSSLSLEIALAQGFKYAANRRPEHPHARDRCSRLPGGAG